MTIDGMGGGSSIGSTGGMDLSAVFHPPRAGETLRPADLLGHVWGDVARLAEEYGFDPASLVTTHGDMHGLEAALAGSPGFRRGVEAALGGAVDLPPGGGVVFLGPGTTDDDAHADPAHIPGAPGLTPFDPGLLAGMFRPGSLGAGTLADMHTVGAAMPMDTSFLHDPSLSVEDKLVMLLAKIEDATQQELLHTAESMAPGGGAGGGAGAAAGSAIGGLLGAVGTALAGPVGGMAGGAIGNALGGAIGGAMGGGGPGGAQNDAQAQAHIQLLTHKLDELSKLVSNVMESNHETRMGFINNIRA